MHFVVMGPGRVKDRTLRGAQGPGMFGESSPQQIRATSGSIVWPYPALTINYAAAQVDGPELLYVKFSRNNSILHIS